MLRNAIFTIKKTQIKYDREISCLEISMQQSSIFNVLIPSAYLNKCSHNLKLNTWIDVSRMSASPVDVILFSFEIVLRY